jgi:hypothetical protein
MPRRSPHRPTFAPPWSRLERDRNDHDPRARAWRSSQLCPGLARPVSRRGVESPRPIETPATAPGDALAVIYSGDGGWGALDRGVAKVLAARRRAGAGRQFAALFPDPAFAPVRRRRPGRQSCGDTRRRGAAARSCWSAIRSGPTPCRPSCRVARRPARPDQGRGADRDRAERRPGVPSRQLAEPADARLLRRRPRGGGAEGLPMTCIYGDKEKLDICPSLPATHDPPGQTERAATISMATTRCWARRCCEAAALIRLQPETGAHIRVSGS